MPDKYLKKRYPSADWEAWGRARHFSSDSDYVQGLRSRFDIPKTWLFDFSIQASQSLGAKRRTCFAPVPGLGFFYIEEHPDLSITLSDGHGQHPLTRGTTMTNPDVTIPTPILQKYYKHNTEPYEPTNHLQGTDSEV